ncbi:glycosyltransferase family 2 protein [Acidovorax sp.]|uniref:glycosyltransferase family 2 protein n=1 Tax=Acidovorax sp. TaxID=1872122 RepID=UPI003BAE6C13
MIDIVVVNWNSGDRLEAVIRSVDLHHCSIVNKVIVVDNASSDDSLKFLDFWNSDGFDFEVVRNYDNVGFGVACNQGAARGEAKYILFLNPDAVIFGKTLSGVVDFMDEASSQGVGVCGVQLIDEAKNIARSCARFPDLRMYFLMAFGLDRLIIFSKFRHHMTDWNHLMVRDVDHVIGAFYFIRRELFDRLGGFDDRFFVYLEDLDLSLRVRHSGSRIVYLANLQAFHEGGGTSHQVKATRLFYSLRSRLLYGFKHFSLPAAWGLVGVTLLIEPVSRVFFALLRGGGEDVRNTLKGYGMLWRALPGILRGQGR